MRPLILAFCAFTLLASCAPNEARNSGDVVVGRLPHWPAAVTAAPNAPPHILAAEISANVIRAGDWWTGRVATTTNVAVVELRSPSFSFILHRSSFGQFNFKTHVLAVPSIYHRGFVATLVARNTAGVTDERSVDLEFR